jgi:hypothetical protein
LQVPHTPRKLRVLVQSTRAASRSDDRARHSARRADGSSAARWRFAERIRQGVPGECANGPRPVFRRARVCLCCPSAAIYLSIHPCARALSQVLYTTGPDVFTEAVLGVRDLDYVADASDRSRKVRVACPRLPPASAPEVQAATASCSTAHGDVRCAVRHRPWQHAPCSMHHAP